MALASGQGSDRLDRSSLVPPPELSEAENMPGQLELLAHSIHGILAHQLAQTQQQCSQIGFNLATGAIRLQS